MPIFKYVILFLFATKAIQTKAQNFTWDKVSIGGGGYNTGILYHPSVPDLIYTRHDADLFRWDASNSKWISLTNWMPLKWSGGPSCDGFAVDPSAEKDVVRQNILYAAFGAYANESQNTLASNGVFRSEDRGNTWKKIWDGVYTKGFYGRVGSFGANTMERMYGERMAVDPNNSNILYVGTSNAGLYRSFDSKADSPTFKKIDGAPHGFTENEFEPRGIRIVMVDPMGGKVDIGTPQERSKVVYLGISSSKPEEKPQFVGGVFKSSDGGETFQRLEGPSAPGRVARMAFGLNGSIFAVEEANYGQKGGIYQYDGKSWTRINGTMGKGFKAIDVNPIGKTDIVAFATNHEIWTSVDGGKTWSVRKWHPYNPKSTSKVVFDNINWTYPSFLTPYTASDLKFDPHNNRGLLFGDAFSINHTRDATADTLHFSPWLKGYESIVGWQLCAPPTGKPKLYVACADVVGFAVEDLKVFPDKMHQLNNVIFPNDQSRGDAAITDIEYAPNAPSSIAATRSTLYSYSVPYPKLYLSEDNGVTWIPKKLPAPDKNLPKEAIHPGPGKIAISCGDKNRMVYVGSNRYPSYTTNAFNKGNITWHKSSGVDFFETDSWVYSVDKIRLAADKKEPLRFYYIKSSDTLQTQIFVSDDGGVTWGVRHAPLPNAKGYGHLMSTVHNPLENRGELWVALGDGGLWKSRDGARTFSKVAADIVVDVHGIAFGAKSADSDYPTLYLAGVLKIDGQLKEGVFLSKDFGATFIPMTLEGEPMVGGTGKLVNDMVGDPNDFGRVYILCRQGVLYSTYQTKHSPRIK